MPKDTLHRVELKCAVLLDDWQYQPAKLGANRIQGTFVYLGRKKFRRTFSIKGTQHALFELLVNAHLSNSKGLAWDDIGCALLGDNFWQIGQAGENRVRQWVSRLNKTLGENFQSLGPRRVVICEARLYRLQFEKIRRVTPDELARTLSQSSDRRSRWVRPQIIVVAFSMMAFLFAGSVYYQLKRLEELNKATYMALLIKVWENGEIPEQLLLDGARAIAELKARKADEALEQLAKGNLELAKKELRKIAEEPDPVRVDAWRQLGAIAFLEDTAEALDAYTHATVLDPTKPSDWEQLGRLLERKGDLRGALHAYEKVVALGENRIDELVVASGVRRMGNVYQMLGKLDEADALFTRALAIARTMGSKKLEAACYNNLGNVYHIRGELDRAQTMFGRAIRINEASGYRRQSATNYGNLGNVFFRRGVLYDKDGMDQEAYVEWGKAETMQRKAIDIDSVFGHELYLAHHYGNLANILLERGELDEAEELHHKAIDIDVSIGRRIYLGKHYGNLGNVYYLRGRLDRAEELIRKAIEIDEDMGCRLCLAKFYTNLGVVSRDRNEWRQAEVYYRRALAIEEELGHRSGVASAYGRLAVLHKMQNQWLEAEALQQNVLKIEKTLGRQSGIAKAYTSLGSIYIGMRNPDLAEAAYLNALAVDGGLGYQRAIWEAHNNLGTINWRKGVLYLDQATEHYLQALDLSQRLGEKMTEASLYADLGRVYYARGELAKARDSLSQSLVLFEALGSPEVNRVMGWLKHIDRDIVPEP